MHPSLVTDGYEIHRAILTDSEVTELRRAADAVADAAGSACVRHLRERSDRFDALSVSAALLSLIPAGLRPVRSIHFEYAYDADLDVNLRWFEPATQRQ